ncbi:hypothetical protein B0T21DRAFT_367518 [Apiosordaria backusii]|uniref:Protein kinase domain-containing protein n=1 Tax=Apiosordaria backusii TaxID=314023 RepID=A0AA40EED3_9PEZI|nr:hypothetical protein B0T21DRAFT_367518 [Apiosordaria backusii]
MVVQNLDLSTLVTCPYEAGNVLTLRLAAGSSRQNDDQSRLLRVKIKKLQEPWTLSCCMVVEILSSSSASVTETAFLKLFDWRFAAQQRSDEGIDPWTEQSAVQYAEFVVSGEAEKFLNQLKRPEDQWSKHQETEEDWDVCQDEAFLVHQSRTMYNNETTVYRRLHELQGSTVPLLIGTVELDIAPPTTNNEKYKTLFKAVVDQAVNITRSLGDYNVLNTDVRIDNFLVACQRGEEGTDKGDGSRESYRVVMIDFAQSRVRRENESDFDWGRAKARQDEEGAVGMVIRHHLSKLGKQVSYTRSGRYDEFAERESEDEK